uniref:RanBD1 domain-containing protein n=1 Tax=Rhabditophanes sp. KR3021 TaxID=114890 RepID=A0AC35TQ51_9BILA
MPFKKPVKGTYSDSAAIPSTSSDKVTLNVFGGINQPEDSIDQDNDSPSSLGRFIFHQLSATEEEPATEEEDKAGVSPTKSPFKLKKDLKPRPGISRQSSEIGFCKSMEASPKTFSSSFEDKTKKMVPQSPSIHSANPSEIKQKSVGNRFAGAHSSFRIRMLQEQHGVKTVEPVSFTTLNPYYKIIFNAF